MTIDEVIEYEKKLAKEIYVEAMLCHANPNDDKLDDCIENGKYHEQLAEWLEELKELRVIFGKIIREIDELQNYACFPTEWVSCEQSEVHTYYAKELTKILKLAEKLKVGGENDD